MPLFLVIGDTLERRRGRKIKYKGWFRDPIRSSIRHVSKSLGIRWLCLAVLVPVPWSQGLWALPFLTVPTLGPKTTAKLRKQRRTLVGWTILMVDKVRRWQRDREIVLLGDGGFAAVPLGSTWTGPGSHPLGSHPFPRRQLQTTDPLLLRYSASGRPDPAVVRRPLEHRGDLC